MSAIEYLLSTHIKADVVRALALTAGVTLPEVEDLYGSNRVQAWAAELVRAVGVEETWGRVAQAIEWGRRAMVAYPTSTDVTPQRLRSRLADVVKSRGDLFRHQAERAIEGTPQVALVRRVDPSLYVLIVDKEVTEFLPQVDVGMKSVTIPNWTLCALAERGHSFRLEIYCDAAQAGEIADFLQQQLGLNFVLVPPWRLALGINAVEQLADELDADIKTRAVRTHQNSTGLRKLRGEAGSAVDDIRNAPFYNQMQAMTDEGDYDVLHIPWGSDTYTLQVSAAGSFWFRAFSPRDLIDEVLRRAESIAGV